MSQVLVTEDYLEDIADAIRAKNGLLAQYKPSQMAAAIEAIPTGGGTGYKLVEYVQGDGSAYINTGILPTQNLTVNVRFNSSETENAHIFGSRVARFSGVFDLLFQPTDQYRYRFGYSDAEGNFTESTTPSYRNISFGKDGFSVNNQEQPISATFNGNSLPIYLLALNNNGTVLSISQAKIYMFVVKDTDTVIANLVPAVRATDSVAGFYDTVRKSFYTNAGSSGALIAGPALT